MLAFKEGHSIKEASAAAAHCQTLRSALHFGCCNLPTNATSGTCMCALPHSASQSEGTQTVESLEQKSSSPALTECSESTSSPRHEASVSVSTSTSTERSPRPNNRLTQHFCSQTVGAFLRSLNQQARQLTQLRAELFLATLSGVLMGLNSGGASFIFVGILQAPYSLISPAPLDALLPLICFFVCLTVGVASGPPGVRVLGDEISIFRRETASGHSPAAYYIGKSFSVVPRIAMVFLSDIDLLCESVVTLILTI